MRIGHPARSVRESSAPLVDWASVLNQFSLRTPFLTSGIVQPTAHDNPCISVDDQVGNLRRPSCERCRLFVQRSICRTGPVYPARRGWDVGGEEYRPVARQQLHRGREKAHDFSRGGMSGNIWPNHGRPPLMLELHLLLEVHSRECFASTDETTSSFASGTGGRPGSGLSQCVLPMDGSR